MAVLGNTSVISLTLLDGVIGNLNPKTTNVYTLGTSSLKWNNVYATTFTGNLTGNVTGNLTGNATIQANNGFTYSGIGTASDNVARPIWFAYNGVNGRPVIDNDFKYNPSNNTITIGTGSLSPTAYSGNAATATTASKLSNTSAVGAADRPVYFTNGGVPSQTTYRMAATNVSARARAITDNLETGIWYVSGTNVTGLYSQSDGAAYVNKYSDSWIAEIYQDYRTGQIAIRGKNNGTWQAWRQVLDSSNYTDYTVTKTGSGASGTWGISISGNAATATKFASAQSVTLTGDVTGTASSQAGWSIATTIGTGKVTNAMLAGSIANNKLANSSITIAGNSVALGGSLAADTLRTSLGLTSAMHFIGKATVAITDGSTTDPTISGYSTKTAGDVIIDKDNSYEYVWTADGKWERLGPDGSYKTTQTAVDSGAAATNKWVSRVQQNANGDVTVTMGTLVTTGDWSGNAGSATKLKTARTLTIGSTGKTFDGSANVSWTLAEIGAAAASHTHGNITNDGALGVASVAVVTDANKKITTADLSVSNPTDATSEAISFIDTISQNAQGKITPTRKSVRVATTSATGVVKVGTGLGVSSGTISVTYGTAANTALQGNQVLFKLNNGDKTASSAATFYAPTAGGTAGYPLIGAGTTTAPAWYGGTVFTGTAAASWKTDFNGTTDATSTTAAAVVMDGGLGVAKQLRTGGSVTLGTLDGNQHVINGSVRIESKNGSYNEGLRINRSSTGDANIYLGGTRNSTSGNQAGGWWIGTLSTPADASSTSTSTYFQISHNSTSTNMAIRGTYDSGWIINPKLTVGTATLSTTYTFYVNGTSYFNNNMIIEKATASTTQATGALVIKGTNAGLGVAGQVNAETFRVNEKVKLEYNATDDSLDFVWA